MDSNSSTNNATLQVGEESEDTPDAHGSLPIFKEDNGGSSIIAKMPVGKDSETYNMNHARRGVALIFNHMHFDPHMKFSDRKGTNKDRDDLSKTLTLLGFDVRVHDDKTVKGLDQVLEGCAAEDHSDADCVLVAVLSHGELNVLYGYDHMYKPEKLWYAFAGDRCPSLAGKPKLFFIQACQGMMMDTGIAMTTMTDSAASTVSYKIPNHADVLIAYSTLPGYYSWRNTNAGSWFIQSLCEVLKDSSVSSNRDLLSLMTKVIRRVAIDFQSNTPKDRDMHGMKQVPCVTSMLTRDVYFSRKKKM